MRDVHFLPSTLCNFIALVARGLTCRISGASVRNQRNVSPSISVPSAPRKPAPSIASSQPIFPKAALRLAQCPELIFGNSYGAE
jgi:hypothetical protein